MPKTNLTATPSLRGITLRNIKVEVKGSSAAEGQQVVADKGGSKWLQCDGIPESVIAGILFVNVTVTGSKSQECLECEIQSTASSPTPKCKHDAV
eukprot:COSAG01_NODE_130_length_24912_cov_83.574175_19_plen_95_part_00